MPPREFQPGEVVGRYTLKKRLGVGSFGEVWRASVASELGFKSEVALKLLRSDRAAGNVDTDLLREARIVAQLHHPNIVDMLFCEEDEGMVLVAMEFMDGGTLDSVVDWARAKKRILPKSTIVQIGRDVAAALHHAWDAEGPEGKPFRLVHRDLKPANVLLGRAGVAKVADYGLAKSSEEVGATATGMVKGTPSYLPPEIWQGSREIGPGVDLFALGCLLWELVMRRRLLIGDTMYAVFARAVGGTADAEAARLAELFPELAPIVRRMIERDPQKRLSDPGEAMEELDRLRLVTAGGDIEDLLLALDVVDGRANEAGKARVERIAQPDWQQLLHGPDVEPTPDSDATPAPALSGGGSGAARGDAPPPLADTARLHAQSGGEDTTATRTDGHAMGKSVARGAARAKSPGAKTGSTKSLKAGGAGNAGGGGKTGATHAMKAGAKGGGSAAAASPAKGKGKAGGPSLPMAAAGAVLLVVLAAGAVWYLRGQSSPATASPSGTATAATDAASAGALAATGAASGEAGAASGPSSSFPGGPQKGGATSGAGSGERGRGTGAGGTGSGASASLGAAKASGPGGGDASGAAATSAASTEEGGPSSAPASSTESAAAPSGPRRCLVLRSAPAGAWLWVDGSRLDLTAPAGGKVVQVSPGSHRIGMGGYGGASVETTATVSEGQAVIVRCDIVQGGCSNSDGPDSLCME